MAMCAVLVFAMAVSAFAVEPPIEPEATLDTDSQASVQSATEVFPDKYYSTPSSGRVALKFNVSGTGEYLNVYSSTGIGDMKQISTWSWTGDSDQKFVVYCGQDGITSIRMYDNLLYGLSTSAGNCILRYLVGIDEKNVTISNIHSEYVLLPNYAWAFDLRAGGTLTATNTSTTVSGGKLVRWETFSSKNKRQCWDVNFF